ncbi:MAG: response regulator, partial [Proteobacteria bacterium]|nr:response regulator [Pseudomonadota bacterium]
MLISPSHTVLIVDDNQVNLNLLRTTLQGVNYTVIAASSAEEALELIRTQSPDIILLDVMMPDMDGFSLCRQLKQDEDFSDIPVIFLTSLSRKAHIVEGFNAGGHDYIVKPFNRQELLARVRNHIHLYDMLLENKRLTRLSEEASRSKSEFLASMSHEIRTPLNSIIGMAEVLAETPLTVEQHNYVSIFRSAGESLLEIINDILDLSKIEAGQTELESIDFHLPTLLNSVVSILSVRAAEQKSHISIHIHSDVPHAISSDPTRLRQILINLVGNAVKFTENGAVEIAVKSNSLSTLLFSIKDNGIGIPKDKQQL